jgi:hypothetical protein
VTKRNVFVLVSLLAVSATSVRAQAAEAARTPSITLPAELDRVLRDYERLWKAGDENGLAELFTTDGFVPARGGWVRGRAAIKERYQSSSGDLRLRALGFATQDTVGYIIGAFGFGEAAATRDAGKFVLALRRPPGSKWLIAADIDNPNN